MCRLCPPSKWRSMNSMNGSFPPIILIRPSGSCYITSVQDFLHFHSVGKRVERRTMTSSEYAQWSPSVHPAVSPAQLPSLLRASIKPVALLNRFFQLCDRARSSSASSKAPTASATIVAAQSSSAW